MNPLTILRADHVEKHFRDDTCALPAFGRYFDGDDGHDVVIRLCMAARADGELARAIHRNRLYAPPALIMTIEEVWGFVG